MYSMRRTTSKLCLRPAVHRGRRFSWESRAEAIAEALGGYRNGACWMARCPAHDDRTPSLAVRETNGTVLVRCHAGCDQQKVLSALRDRGLWRAETVDTPETTRHESRDSATNHELRTEAALRVWSRVAPAKGTLVEQYLAHRGITLPIPQTIGFHRGLKHPSGVELPAMVTLVSRGRNGNPLAIHRTFLERDGCGKASVNPNRMMLGPCRGGAVRLSESIGNKVMVGEGIETCLAAMQVLQVPTWAALSTSGLRTLELPDTVEEVVILADGDPPGEAAARQAAARWVGQGRHVRIARAPAGHDFNDVLMGRTHAIKEQ